MTQFTEIYIQSIIYWELVFSGYQENLQLVWEGLWWEKWCAVQQLLDW